jgi:phosphate:Na+ symporter
LALEAPRKIANADTLVKVLSTPPFIGFPRQIASLVKWLVPDRPPGEKPPGVRAGYLDGELLATPSLAIDRARLEVLHMGERVQRMMPPIMLATSPATKRLSARWSEWTMPWTPCTG